jgi:DDE family transposase
MKKSPAERFTYQPESNRYRCPAGEQLNYVGLNVRNRARELVNTPEFAKAQQERKKVEALFAELKNQIGLRRLRLRRLKFVREQFFLATAAQNIKRLVRSSANRQHLLWKLPLSLR